MVLKLTSPRGPSALELAAKVGVSHSTLSRWLKEETTLPLVSKNDDDRQRGGDGKKPRRPQDWLPEEKLRLLQQAARLSGDERGALLRREGVHEADLAQWREQADKGALTALSGTRQRTAEQKRIRQLESELARKEKALAETAALLVLTKKVRALWGDNEDDDTTGSNEP